MTNNQRTIIPSESVVGILRPITLKGPYDAPEKTGFRDIETDIHRYNAMVKAAQTVTDILRPGAGFLHRQFGNLKTHEIYMQYSPQVTPELIVKCRCRCGSIVSAPLKALIEGNLTNCGCRTPLPKEYATVISISPSEIPNNSTTTVDGIQWLGTRYMWFVTLFVRGICVVRAFTEDTHTALRIRQEAEEKYYGESYISDFKDLMYEELELFRKRYIARHPPKVEGIYKINGKWNARLWYCHHFILNKTFNDRESAVKARLSAEKKYYGAAIMAERYYV